MMRYVKVSLLLFILGTLLACDRINNASRTIDTMLGGDFEVHILGHDEPYIVTNGKITSVPEKGYYIFYPRIEGKKTLVQSPIQLTTIIKTD